MSGLFENFRIYRPGYDTDVVTDELRQTGALDLSGATVFDEVSTAEYTPDISINPTYGLTDYRLIIDGDVTEQNGTFRCRADGSTTTSYIETAEVGKYNSGSMAGSGILAFLSRDPTGNEEPEWGYFDRDNDNGFVFGHDATSMYVRRYAGGADKGKVRPADWLDPMDGTGPSGATLNFLKPTICRTRMALYGQGPAEMRVLVEKSDGTAAFVTVYRFWAEEGEMIVTQWGLPIRGIVTNGGDGTTLDLHVGGMQFGIFGRALKKPRTTGETIFNKSLNGTTITPILSFRKKAAFNGVNVRVLGYTPVSADNLQILIIVGGTLTGASFGSLTNVRDGETVLEVDSAATAVTGGDARYEDVFAGGGGNKLESPGPRSLGQALPRDTNITLAARRFSSSGGSGTFTFRAEEDW